MFYLFFFSSLGFALPDFDKAEKEIQYLKPSEVQSFPQEVKAKLEKENCRIPIVPGSKEPNGWAKGSFANKDQTDWAVLCSNKGKSAIKIVWGGVSKPCPGSLNLQPNNRYLQTFGEGNIIFSRSISSIQPNEIATHFKKNNSHLPKALNQDGIVDAFIDKGSTIHFCVAGKWQNELGAD